MVSASGGDRDQRCCVEFDAAPASQEVQQDSDPPTSPEIPLKNTLEALKGTIGDTNLGTFFDPCPHVFKNDVAPVGLAPPEVVDESLIDDGRFAVEREDVEDPGAVANGIEQGPRFPGDEDVAGKERHGPSGRRAMRGRLEQERTVGLDPAPFEMVDGDSLLSGLCPHDEPRAVRWSRKCGGRERGDAHRPVIMTVPDGEGQGCGAAPGRRRESWASEGEGFGVRSKGSLVGRWG